MFRSKNGKVEKTEKVEIDFLKVEMSKKTKSSKLKKEKKNLKVETENLVKKLCLKSERSKQFLYQSLPIVDLFSKIDIMVEH